jgi:phage head maturation protease
MQRFNIFSGLLKAYEDDAGKKRLHTTASSTIKDLVGDEITPAAINKMAERARGNLTIFLNHEYKVPEDVLGSAEKADVVDRGIDGDGNPVVDLDFDIAVNETNPRAVSTWEAIDSGVKLGTSIGAIVRTAKKKKDGGLVISDLELLEASIVGIPANPRSWVQYAVKSLTAVEILDDQAVIEEYVEPLVSTLEDGTVLRRAEKSADGETVTIAASTWDKMIDIAKERNELLSPATEELALAVEPDLVEGKTRVTVTVTTEEPNAQEAPASGSAPGDAGLLDETAEGDDAALGDNVTRDAEPVLSDAVELVSEEIELPTEMIGLKAADLSTVFNALKSALTKIGELEKSNLELTQKNAELEENFSAAREIVERISNLPMGRKTYFVQATSDFRRRFPMYDDDFVRMLER